MDILVRKQMPGLFAIFLLAALLQSCEPIEEVVCTSANLLTDGSLEDSALVPDWAWSFSNGVTIQDANDASDGIYFAIIPAGFPTAESISQSVTVPAYSIGLRLTGRFRVVTGNPTASNNDILQLTVNGDTYVLLDNADVSVGNETEWRKFHSNTLASYAEQDVEIRLAGSGDGSGATEFQIDVLRLVAIRDCN